MACLVNVLRCAKGKHAARHRPEMEKPGRSRPNSMARCAGGGVMGIVRYISVKFVFIIICDGFLLIYCFSVRTVLLELCIYQEKALVCVCVCVSAIDIPQHTHTHSHNTQNAVHPLVSLFDLS